MLQAIYGWRYRSEGQRVALVSDLFNNCAAFQAPQIVDTTTLLHRISKLSQVLLDVRLTGDPFYAVIATKKG